MSSKRRVSVEGWSCDENYTVHREAIGSNAAWGTAHKMEDPEQDGQGCRNPSTWTDLIPQMGMRMAVTEGGEGMKQAGMQGEGNGEIQRGSQMQRWEGGGGKDRGEVKESNGRHRNKRTSRRRNDTRKMEDANLDMDRQISNCKSKND